MKTPIQATPIAAVSGMLHPSRHAAPRRRCYLSPRYPSTKRTMTTTPTIQMMLFMRSSCLQLSAITVNADRFVSVDRSCCEGIGRPRHDLLAILGGKGPNCLGCSKHEIDPCAVDFGPEHERHVVIIEPDVLSVIAYNCEMPHGY